MQRRVSKCCLLFYPTSPSFSLFTSLSLFSCCPVSAAQKSRCLWDVGDFTRSPVHISPHKWSPLSHHPLHRKIIFRLKAPSERKGILRHLRTLGTLTFPVTLVSVVMGLNLTVIRELSQSAPTISLCSPSLLLDHILFVQPLKVLYIEKAGGGG